MPRDEKRSNPAVLEIPGRRPAQRLLDYFASLRRFDRNAKLFLIYALLSGLGTGIWNVMFNIEIRSSTL